MGCNHSSMGHLPDTQNCGLRMRRERFPRHRLQRKPLASDPGMHHCTSVMHVSWCMSGSLTHGGGESVPGIPGACTTRNFTYLVRGPCPRDEQCKQKRPQLRRHIIILGNVWRSLLKGQYYDGMCGCYPPMIFSSSFRLLFQRIPQEWPKTKWDWT